MILEVNAVFFTFYTTDTWLLRHVSVDLLQSAEACVVSPATCTVAMDMLVVDDVDVEFSSPAWGCKTASCGVPVAIRSMSRTPTIKTRLHALHDELSELSELDELDELDELLQLY